MAIDYTTHPADLAAIPAGHTGTAGIKELRAAIPAHCHKPSLGLSIWYLGRDLFFATVIAAVAFHHIPGIESAPIRILAWIFYGWLEGLVFTGIWVIGHDCGHSSFATNSVINDTVGFLLHSALLTPYFSWQSTHRRHHIYANHIELDQNYVPPDKEHYLKSLGGQLQEVTEDAPFYILARILFQQLFGFPLYLLANVAASVHSLPDGNKPSRIWLATSHFTPFGVLFRKEEVKLILASDLGVLAAGWGLYVAMQQTNVSTVLLLYLQPYLWLNHWIVAITFLHHTHPNVPKYDADAWTFIKGATATVDRELGLIGKHCFHNIVEYHVIHHLFSRIPHYRTEEATRAIQPLLGKSYRTDKARSFWVGYWEAFTQCQWVAPDTKANPKDRALWYQSGRLPPPEFCMGEKRWIPKF